jgi:hypothetical protein
VTPSRSAAVGVAGVQPRPSLRDLVRAARHRAGPGVLPGLGPGPRCAHLKVIVLPPGTKGRCRGSAPALVARSWSSTASGTDGLGVAGARPRPLLRDAVRAARHRAGPRALPGLGPGPRCAQIKHLQIVGAVTGCCRGPAPALVARGSPRTRRSVASGRCCRGSAPALVARKSWRTPTSASSSRRCRGFGPGPRCVQEAFRAYLEDPQGVAGARPRPSLRVPDAGPLLGCGHGGIAGVRPRPSLSGPGLRGRHSRHDRHCWGSAPALAARGPCIISPGLVTRRCRGSPPALVVRRASRPARPLPRPDVAGVRPRPSLRADAAAGHRPQRRRRCRGSNPGPRCAALTSIGPRSCVAACCRVLPRPSLRVLAEHHLRTSAQADVRLPGNAAQAQAGSRSRSVDPGPPGGRRYLQSDACRS